MNVLSTMIKGTRAEGPARRLLMKMRKMMGEEGSVIDSRAFTVMKQVLRCDSNCIDIGCAQGLYLHEMLRLAPNGQHMAFEPIPALHRLLQSRFDRFPNVAIHNLALSDQAGATKFHWNVNNPGWSGLKQRDYPDEQDRIEILDVSMKRLDDLVSAETRVDLIKIDVEGAELKVLEGARSLLARCRPVVIFEYGLGSAEFYEAWPEAMFDLLQEAGLMVTPLEAYLTGGPSCDRNVFAKQFRDHLCYYFVAYPDPVTGP